MIVNWKDVIKTDNCNNFYNGGWVKEVTGVDTSKSNGYCFEGDFVSGANKGLVECGDGYYIVCSVEGSRKNQYKDVAMFQIAGDKVEKIIDWVTGNDWALKIRDRVAELLYLNFEDETEKNLLSGIFDEDLIAELKKRGYKVEKKQ